MILAKELMEGNKFLSIFGNVETVASIIENTDKGRINSYVSERHRLMYSHLIVPWENGNQYKPLEIDPIPLSCKVLEQLRFECEPVGYNDFSLKAVWVKGNFVLNEYNDGDFGFSWGEDGEILEVVSVHQLQNLYSNLTKNTLDVSNLVI